MAFFLFFFAAADDFEVFPCDECAVVVLCVDEALVVEDELEDWAAQHRLTNGLNQPPKNTTRARNGNLCLTDTVLSRKIGAEQRNVVICQDAHQRFLKIVNRSGRGAGVTLFVDRPALLDVILQTIV